MSSAGCSTPKYRVDAVAAPLARGERPETWGLNINVQGFPIPDAAFREAWGVWSEQAQKALHGCGALAYAYDHLHITAASPAPFTNAALAGWSEEEKQLYEAAWLEALREYCCVGNPAGLPWPSEPFPLVFAKLELHATCAIFMVDDPTGSVAKVRQCIAACARHPALASGRVGELRLLERSGFKTPAIIHSTIVRFALPREEGVTDADIEARWAQAAALWRPTTVMAERMTLIRETVPYQHLAPGQGLIAEFPYLA